MMILIFAGTPKQMPLPAGAHAYREGLSYHVWVGVNETYNLNINRTTSSASSFAASRASGQAGSARGAETCRRCR